MLLRLALCVCAMLLLAGAVAAEVPQMLNYQGRLVDGGGQPVTVPVDVIFALWNAAANGDSLWSEPRVITPDGNGAFITMLGAVAPIPDSAFAGPAFLSVKVEADPEMSPRAQIVSVGYAYRVGSLEGAAGGGITGSILVYNPTGDTTIINPDQIVIRGAGGDEEQVYCTASGLTVTDANGDVRISIAIDEDGPGITLYESASTLTRGAQDVGARKVEFREGGVLLYGASDLDTVCHLLPNGSIVGRGQLTMGTSSSADGDWANVLGYDNSADGDSATVGGGYGNSAAGYVSTISGGALNTTSGFYSTIGGGYNNSADSIAVVGGGTANAATRIGAVVAGGTSNIAGGIAATICGGVADTAMGDYSFIGGGLYNKAAGASAVVPGGSNNHATGGASFAAGRYARADHDKTFVWNDGGSNGIATFSSTNTRQFLINAGNGVGINTNSPSVPLHVEGGTDVTVSSGGYLTVGSVAGRNITLDDNEIMARNNGAAGDLVLNRGSGDVFLCDDGAGDVGIGTTSPSYPLDVNGDIECTTLHETSDARFKSDVAPITGALATVGQLRGVTHTWNRDDYPERQFDDKAHLGFLAQEIQDVVPELVSPDADGYLAVDYSHMAPLLVEAIKELKAQNESKDARIDQLEAKLAELQAMLEKIILK